MGDRSKIEWTEASWNPVVGCDKVSAGCDHCYAETIATRFAGTKAYPDGFQVTLRPDKLDQPLRWTRARRIFVNSMSDLFHAQVPDKYIAKVFAVMMLTQRHTYQILTKRPGRMRSLMANRGFWRQVAFTAGFEYSQTALALAKDGHVDMAGLDAVDRGGPLPNVWLGVSVEDQKWARVRIPVLLDTPAAVRFLSCEPLLSRVDLTAWLPPTAVLHHGVDPGGVLGRALGRAVDAQLAQSEGRPAPVYPDWVIVGGESGHHARPMNPAWARQLRDQCTIAYVPFLFKQWGEWVPAPLHGERGATHVFAGGYWAPAHAIDPREPFIQGMRKVGRKQAGRELDGRTWDQYPRGEERDA